MRIDNLAYGGFEFDDHGGVSSFGEETGGLGAAIDVNTRDLGLGSAILMTEIGRNKALRFQKGNDRCV